MRIFVQNQGMREILPQAYSYYSEDKILQDAHLYATKNEYPAGDEAR